MGRMTPVYLLCDAALPDADKIAGIIESAAAGGQYPLRRIAELPLLQEALQGEKRAVVIFSAPPEAVGLTVQQLRLALPTVGCVAVVDAQDATDTAVLEYDCLCLKRPLDGFTLLSMLSGAARQSDLLALMTDCAQLDEVTNLFNRRYFIQRLSEEISLSRRHLTPLCVVVLSIGFYQGLLDSYGYEFMNQMLRFLANKISGSVRHEDIIARIGDDEIGILLPRSTEKGAKIFTNRLVLELNACIFSHQGYDEEIMVSAGVAGYPLPDNSPADADTVIRYARHALHQAKCSEEEHVRVQLFSEINPVL